MSALAATLRPIPLPSFDSLRADPVAQVSTLLRLGFFVLPVLMGIDKFAEVANYNWPMYLAPEFNDVIPGSAQDAMYAVGVVEIVAGFVVLTMFGSPVTERATPAAELRRSEHPPRGTAAGVRAPADRGMDGPPSMWQPAWGTMPMHE